MNIDSAYPSKHLKASDLDGRRVTVTIDHIEIETLRNRKNEEEDKVILYFQRKNKGMVLNVTNKNTIKRAYGAETDSWPGCIVILYSARVEAFGEMTDALRIDIPQGTVAAAPASPLAAEPFVPTTPEPSSMGDDDIPF